MPRDEKRRQRSLERKAAKRKEKRQIVRQVGGLALPSAAPRPAPRSAETWPMHECLISRDWQQEAALVQAVVARRSPSGEIGAGIFLIDLGCLGVKNAFTRLYPTQAEYEWEVRERIAAEKPMVKADLNLVAKIIREGIAYASAVGIDPHRDYYRAEPLLAGADPDAVSVHVPLGRDGKPFYLAGPYDDVRSIMAKLTKAVGPDGFHYLIGGPVS
ncbi:MAG: hypothetical protein HY331_06680 [Chloroflexi bacterium]|nr:hypothetical protein [Chloroflexota bacterium]